MFPVGIVRLLCPLDGEDLERRDFAGIGSAAMIPEELMGFGVGGIKT